MSCNNKQTVKVLKTHGSANLPIYATSGAAAADVTCVSWKDTEGHWQESPVYVNPGKAVILDTGLRFELPVGYELKCYSRSGHGFKNGIRLSNCTGILDSDYRGNLMVKLHNDSDTAFRIEMGERILQVQVAKAVQHAFVEVDELGETERGEGGFGSTGVKQIPNNIPVNDLPAHDHGHKHSVYDGVHTHIMTNIATNIL